MENADNKEREQCRIVVYNSHVDGSWRSRKYYMDSNGKVVSPEENELEAAECKIVEEICKLFSRGECLAQGPKYISLPSGVYCCDGSGFNFCTHERDIGYTRLSEQEEKLLLAYDRLTAISRAIRCVVGKWRWFKWRFGELFMIPRHGVDVGPVVEEPNDEPAPPEAPEIEATTEAK